jgi:predicted glycosyltransferase involved in capsule biosynthesis
MFDPERGKGIVLLVPFRDDHAIGRGVNWAWLRQHWEHELPAAQIVIGTDEGDPFSKTCAVNNGFKIADPANDIIAMIDADCYISGSVILSCAARIREARRWREPLWFVPYRHLYRLTEKATAQLVASNPKNPVKFVMPHISEDVGSSESAAAIGHRFGALIQIYPREAFTLVGGVDPRFRGWGGEDVTFVRVLDTLYGIHETTPNEVLTLWHTALGDVYLRKWSGQPDIGANDQLSIRYRRTRRDPLRMKAIINEWLDDDRYAEYRI